MNKGKLSWYVAIGYSDDTTDIVRSTDYHRLIHFAVETWQTDVAAWQATGHAGILCVQLFDERGRVLWDSNAEPSGLGTTGHIDHVNAFRNGRPVVAEHGPITFCQLQ